MKIRHLWWLPVVTSFWLSWYYYHPIEHWIAHGTGSYNTPGAPHNYNYNSGFGSIVEPPLITLVGLAIGYWWHNQCHVSRCYWPARKRTAAGDLACWRHHPHRHLSAADILRRHEQHSVNLITELRHATTRNVSLLDEIHRHVQKLAPDAGAFPPPPAEGVTNEHEDASTSEDTGSGGEA